MFFIFAPLLLLIINSKLESKTPGDGDGSTNGNCPVDTHKCFNGGACAVCITGDIGTNAHNGCLTSTNLSQACNSGTTCSDCSKLIISK